MPVFVYAIIYRVTMEIIGNSEKRGDTVGQSY